MRRDQVVQVLVVQVAVQVLGAQVVQVVPADSQVVLVLAVEVLLLVHLVVQVVVHPEVVSQSVLSVKSSTTCKHRH